MATGNVSSGSLLTRVSRRLDETVRLRNRSHEYSPASKYRTMLYAAGFGNVGEIVAESLTWLLLLGPIGLIPLGIFALAKGLLTLFPVFAKAYLDSEIAAGNFVIIGRRGIAHVRDFNFFGPIVTQNTWPGTDAQGKPVLYTRFLAWRWLRKKGTANVPKSVGGGRGGYIACIQNQWTKQHPLGTTLDWHTDAEIAKGINALEGTIPGQHQDIVVNLRYHFENGTAEELPDLIRDAIKEDSYHVDDSPVDIGYDPLPDDTTPGAVYPPNAIARLWALEHLVGMHQVGAIDQSMEIAMMAQAGRQAYGTTVVVQGGQQPPVA